MVAMRTSCVGFGWVVGVWLCAACGGGAPDGESTDVDAVMDAAPDFPIPDEGGAEPEVADTTPETHDGNEFLVLTYNVAGLPEGIEGCLAAFAAEQSRLEGRTVDVGPMRSMVFRDGEGGSIT